MFAGPAVAAERRKKTSTIREKIQEILKDEVAEDPIDGTRWTRKTTQSISEELFVHGIEVSANTVGRLLHAMDFSLKTNRKNIESGFKRKRGDRARRNRQFMVIAAKRRKFDHVSFIRRSPPRTGDRPNHNPHRVERLFRNQAKQVGPAIS